jgi:hypothetical protein
MLELDIQIYMYKRFATVMEGCMMSWELVRAICMFIVPTWTSTLICCYGGKTSVKSRWPNSSPAQRISTLAGEPSLHLSLPAATLV